MNFMKHFIIIVVIVVMVFVLFIAGAKVYCNNWGDKYTLDGYCHDPIYRCQVESGNYDWNFTGHIDGCMCDCGVVQVSVCSGFAYKLNGSALSWKEYQEMKE